MTNDFLFLNQLKVIGNTRQQQEISGTGHYICHCIEDGTIYTLDDEKAVKRGTLGDLRNSEIFFYKKV